MIEKLVKVEKLDDLLSLGFKFKCRVDENEYSVFWNGELDIVVLTLLASGSTKFICTTDLWPYVQHLKESHVSHGQSMHADFEGYLCSNCKKISLFEVEYWKGGEKAPMICSHCGTNYNDKYMLAHDRGVWFDNPEKPAHEQDSPVYDPTDVGWLAMTPAATSEDILVSGPEPEEELDPESEYEMMRCEHDEPLPEKKPKLHEFQCSGCHKKFHIQKNQVIQVEACPFCRHKFLSKYQTLSEYKFLGVVQDLDEDTESVNEQEVPF